jgi:hypothetical protein
VLCQAISIREQDEPGVVRWLVEAGILTGGTNQVIGDAVGVAPECIGLFHDVFWNVRAQLNSPTWIQPGLPN